MWLKRKVERAVAKGVTTAGMESERELNDSRGPQANPKAKRSIL